MSVACSIPYIDNSTTIVDKDIAKEQHLSIVRKLLSYTDLNLKAYSRTSKVTGKQIKYLGVPSGKTGQNQKLKDLEEFLNNEFNGEVKITTIGTNKGLVIDITGDFNSQTDEDFDYLAQEREYAEERLGQTLETHEDLESILSDDESRFKMFEILGDIKGTIETLYSDPKVKNSKELGSQLKFILDGFKDEDFLYKYNAAFNFIKWAKGFTQKNLPRFTGKESLLNKLEKINNDTTLTYEDRKKLRSDLAKTVDILKNKYYVFSKLKEVVEQLGLGNREIADVFETYNKYEILSQLEKSSEPIIQGDILEFEKIIFKNYKDRAELLDALETQANYLGLNNYRSEFGDIVDASVFKTLLDEKGNIKKTLIAEVLEARNDFFKIQEGINKFMLESQVDLLYDAHLNFNLKINLAEVENYRKTLDSYQNDNFLTKEKIKDSILKANSNIGLHSYYLKSGTDIDDNQISLMTQLLQMTVLEADVQKFKEFQAIDSKFSQHKDKTAEFSKKMLTYSFDLTNPVNPVKLQKGNGNTLVYKSFKKKGDSFEETEEELQLTNPVYGRYYKLKENSDDVWAYKGNDGDFYLVTATKAIKGLNGSHRFKIEQSIHHNKLEELVNQVDAGQTVNIGGSLVSKTVQYQSGKTFILSREQIQKKLNAAFYAQFSEALSPSKAEAQTNAIIDEIAGLNKVDKREVLDKHFKYNFADTKINTLLSSIKNEANGFSYNTGIIKSKLYDAYLIELTNGSTELLTAQVDSKTQDVTFYDANSNKIKQSDIKYFYTKGSSYFTFLEDKVLEDLEFNNDIKSNVDFKDFYNKYIEEYNKLAEKDHTGALVDGKIGQIIFKDSQTYTQLLKELKDNPTEALKNKFNDFFKVDQEELIELKNAKGQLTDKSGRVLNENEKPIMVPKRKPNVDGIDISEFKPSYTNRVHNQDYVSEDLIVNLMGMVDQSTTFEKIYEIEPQLRFALLTSKGSEFTGGAALNIKGKKLADQLDKNAKNANKALEFFIKTYGYNDPIIKDSLGRGTKVETVLETLKKMTYFQQLALNLRSNIFNNLPIGQINNFLVASSNKYGLKESDVVSSYKEIYKDLGSILNGTVGRTNVSDSHYISKLAHMFGAVAGLAVNSKNFTENKSWTDKYLSTESLYLIQSGTEVLNQLPLMIGFMKTYVVSKNEDGSDYTMYDAVRINGKPIGKGDKKGVMSLVNIDGSEITNDIVTDFSYKLSKLNSQAQGDFGKLHKIMARYELFPSLALTFAGWLYPNLRKRFSRDFRFNKETQKQNTGGYQLNFILNTFGNLDDYKELYTFGPEQTVTEHLKEKGLKLATVPLLGALKTIGSLPLNILNTFTGFKGYENEQFKKLVGFKDVNSKEFQDFFQIVRVENESDEDFKARVKEGHLEYVNALQTASKEYTIISALIILGLVLNALGDDEGEDPTTKGRILKFLEVQSRQLSADLTLGAPLLNPLKPVDFFTQRSKDPFVILRTIDINRKFIMNVVGFQINLEKGDYNFNIDDTYKKTGPGYEKGDLKLLKTAERAAFSPFYQISKFTSAEQQESTIKLMNQSAIFTDKDLEEEEE